MTMEPERPIEKLLRACAKERRDQAGTPLELHPATRRLLQGEVARQFARKAHGPEAPFRRLVRLWPRLAWSLAALVMLAAGVWLLLPVKDQRVEEARLAKNERRLLEPAPARSPAEPQGQMYNYGLAGNRRADPAKAKEAPDAEAGWKEADKDRAAAKLQTAAGGIVNTPAQVPAESLKQETKAPGVRSQEPGVRSQENNLFAPKPQAAPAPTVAAAAPAPPPAPSAPGTSGAAAAKQPIATDQLMGYLEKPAAQPGPASKSLPAAGSAGLVDSLSIFTNSLSFNNLAAATSLKNAAGTNQGIAQAPAGAGFWRRSGAVASQTIVLASFRMEQSGQKLRVIDLDGSVYTGYLQAMQATNAAPGQKTAGYFFRAAGTNRSLNQKVIFTGTLLPGTNAATAAPSTNRSRRNFGGLTSTRAESSLSPAPAAPDALPLRNSRISGKAVLANGQELEIDAVPTSP